MSRANDLAAADHRLAILQATATQAQTKFAEYSDQVTELISETLKTAGVFDEVHELEQERNRARQELTNRLQVLQREADGLAQAKRFLLEREVEEQATKPKLVKLEEETEEETEEEVDESEEDSLEAASDPDEEVEAELESLTPPVKAEVAASNGATPKEVVKIVEPIPARPVDKKRPKPPSFR